MEFRLDEAQVELQQTVARLCRDRVPLDLIAEREGRAVDPQVWAALAELGVLGLMVPEAEGGVGLGVIEAAIVFEQLGSHPFGGPLVWSVLAAPYLAGVTEGSTIVTGIEASSIVDGSALVEHLDAATVMLVVHGDRVVAHDVASLPPATPLEPLDPLATISRLDGLDGLDGLAAGDAGGGQVIVEGAAEVEGFVTLAKVLGAALLSGVADRSLHVARDYALEREQFGAAIGSFQAVKHLLADMYGRTVSAQSLTYAAAAVLDDPIEGDTPARDAASAKLLAADAAITNASTAVQILGGMGFTWDMLPNYLLKRAWALDNEFGTVEHHEALVGRAVGALVGTLAGEVG